MAFALDPQVKAAFAPMSAAMAGAVPPPVGDVQTSVRGKPQIGHSGNARLRTAPTSPRSRRCATTRCCGCFTNGCGRRVSR